ncbi:hypothetical protein DFJ73DRAFT_805197 [Zopfochytrium polystomum]|nr:hypothetical protein DFJ73DRAFT_805197 [Zopfochytrium polystomum]
MAEAAEELMKKWEHVREWEIPEFQFEPQACLVSDFVIENEAWSKTRTVLDKLFGLQNVYFRRMDLADGGGNHSRGCYYYDPARENYLSTGNLKLTNAFPRKAAPGDVAERGSIVFGDVSTLPQHDASTAVYHPAALQRVPQQVFNFDFGVESAKRLQFVRWPCRLDVCHENSGICAFYQEFLSTICVVIYPLMG